MGGHSVEYIVVGIGVDVGHCFLSVGLGVCFGEGLGLVNCRCRDYCGRLIEVLRVG